MFLERCYAFYQGLNNSAWLNFISLSPLPTYTIFHTVHHDFSIIKNRSGVGNLFVVVRGNSFEVVRGNSWSAVTDRANTCKDFFFDM